MIEGSIPLRERRSIADEWQEFERTCIPEKAPPMQRREMKRAWYAGAAMMMGLVTNGLDADKEPTELDVAFMESVHNELTVFANRLGVGLE